MPGDHLPLRLVFDTQLTLVNLGRGAREQNESFHFRLFCSEIAGTAGSAALMCECESSVVFSLCDAVTPKLPKQPSYPTLEYEMKRGGFWEGLGTKFLNPRNIANVEYKMEAKSANCSFHKLKTFLTRTKAMLDDLCR